MWKYELKVNLNAAMLADPVEVNLLIPASTEAEAREAIGKIMCAGWVSSEYYYDFAPEIERYTPVDSAGNEISQLERIFREQA